jgi:SH3-like domain-containing protein
MGMRPSIEPWFPKMLYVVLQLTAPKARAWARGWTWVMLISIIVAILPWQAVAEMTSPALSHIPEQAPGSLRRGIVTRISKLRASPSMHSEIVAVAKEGTRVKILLESGRWFQVRSEEGVEAWIYKPLVLIEQEPIQSPSETPAAVALSDLTETASAAATTSDILVESPTENTLEGPGSDASSAVPIRELYLLPQITWMAWVSDTWLSHLRGRAAYIIIALVMVLVLSIARQLRAARQLRQAMQEVGQILNIVEEIYAGGMLVRTNDSGTMLNPMTAEVPAQQPPPPGIEFSPTEYMVLEALSDQLEVQETELGKILDEKGCTGVLIKAIIGDIVRKTEMIGFPWVEVRYVQGRYRYRLRPEAVPNLSVQRLERR